MKKKYYSPITKFFVTTMCLLLWDIMDKCVRFSFKKKINLVYTCSKVTGSCKEKRNLKFLYCSHWENSGKWSCQDDTAKRRVCANCWGLCRTGQEVFHCVSGSKGKYWNNLCPNVKGSLNITVVQWIISLQKGNNFHVRRVRAR